MAHASDQQYLSFTLDGGRYAVRVENVHEVLEYTRFTNLPRTSEFMKGIISLRGKGIPVLDLRLKLGMEETPILKDTAIIVMKIGIRERATVVGVMADAVHEVIDLPDSDIDPPPRFGSGDCREYILGVAKLAAGFIVVLDLEKIIDAMEHSDLPESDDAAVPGGATVEAAG